MNLMTKLNIEFSVTQYIENWSAQIRILGSGGRRFTQAHDKSMSFLVWRPSAKFIMIFPNLYPELSWECRHTQN